VKAVDIEKLAAVLDSSSRDLGDNVLVQCPFAPWKHKGGADDTESMSIKVNDRGPSVYYCHACDEAGRNLDQLMVRLDEFGLDDDTFERASTLIDKSMASLEEMTDDYEDVVKPPLRVSLHLPPPSEIQQYTDMDYEYTFGPLDQTGVDYLRYERKVSKASAELWGLRYDETEQRIVFPIRWHDGTIVGASGRAARKELRRDADGKKEVPYYNYWRFEKKYVLFGEHLLTEEPVVVVEGQFDAIKVRQAGFNCVATMGAKIGRQSKQHGQVRKLVEWGQPVVIFFDNDEAGEKGEERLRKALERQGIRVQSIAPPPGRDAGDLSKSSLIEMLGPLVSVEKVIDVPEYWR
jgi:5S rRNA maturation endonuclease (ribonuclease M5)